MSANERAMAGGQHRQVRHRALARHALSRLGEVLEWSVPSGGIWVWARVTRPLDVTRWLEVALARGVAVSPGRRYTFDGREPGALRLVFARFDDVELRRAVEVLAGAVPR